MNSTVNGTIASFITTRESNLVRCVFMAFSYSIIFVSLVGNSLVIIAVKKDIGGHMQNSNNYFILNLSVADLILSILLLLAVVIKTALNQRFLGSEWTIHGVLGQVLCKAYQFTFSTLSLVSVFWILAISIDRACAILLPLKILITKRVARIITILAWIVPGVFTSYKLYFYDVVTFDRHILCTLPPEHLRSVQLIICMLLHVLLTALIFVIVVLLYTAIAIKLWFTSSPGHQSTEAQKRRKKMNRKVFTLLVIILLAFYICHLPTWLYQLSFNFEELSHLNLALRNNGVFILISAFMILCHGAINPCLYALFLPKFRTAYCILIRKMLFCQKSSPANNQDAARGIKRSDNRISHQ